MSNIKGIDVSRWQEDTDWERVKAAGIKFVMIRANFGMEMCSKFLENIRGASKVGLDIGIYAFSRALSVEEVKEEAQFVLKLIQGYEIAYPVAYDIENEKKVIKSKLLSKRTISDMIVAFNEIIADAGYTPVVYSNLNWLRNFIDYNKIKKYDIWLAQYEAVRPTFNHPIKMWQHSQTGRVDGVKGNVDLNISYKDYGKERRDMLKKIDDLEREISTLKKANASYAKQIDSLEVKNEKLNRDNEKLEGSLQNQLKTLVKYQNAGLHVEKIVKDAFKSGSLNNAPIVGNEILGIIDQFK